MRGILAYSILTLFVFASIAMTGCGKKGPPISPESVVPVRIDDLRISVIDGEPYLIWSKPLRNVDGSRLDDLAGFKILKRGRGEKPGEMITQLIDIPLSSPPASAKITEKIVYLRDQGLKEGWSYTYQVFSYNKEKYYGDGSNIAGITWIRPLPPPDGFRVNAGDHRVELFWKDDSEKEGLQRKYNIYRRLRGEQYPLIPINEKPISGGYFQDLQVENEKEYFYTIRTVFMQDNIVIEGKSSQELLAKPRDLTPPPPPPDVVAVPGEEGVVIKWTPVFEKDLAGYNVYRTDKLTQEKKKLNNELLTDTSYIDKEIQKGSVYIYTVTAVDSSPQRNESIPSQGIEVKIRE